MVKQSLSSRVFSHLVKDMRATPEEIASLTGRLIENSKFPLFSNRSYTLARVLATGGRRVDYEWLEAYNDDESLVLTPKGRGNIDVFYITENPWQNKVFGVHTNDPIRVLLGAADASFVRYDPYLDEILEEGMKANPQIRSFRDLENLTQWVHDAKRYKKIRTRKNSMEAQVGVDRVHSLGEVWKNWGRVCTHFAAYELALLLLHKIPAMLVGSSVKTRLRLHAGHSFLEVTLPYEDNERYVVDPTANIVVPHDDFVVSLAIRGKKVGYYRDYERKGIYPLWWDCRAERIARLIGK